MIIDTLNNCELYYVFGERFKKALEYLKSNDISKMKPGRYDIEGDGLYILIQDFIAASIDDSRLESHKHYVDIHYVKEGFEHIGYIPMERVSKDIYEYDEKSDHAYYGRECDFYLLRENDIAIVFPHDVHMPRKRASIPVHVRKACAKIRLAP